MHKCWKYREIRRRDVHTVFSSFVLLGGKLMKILTIDKFLHVKQKDINETKESKRRNAA